MLKLHDTNKKTPFWPKNFFLQSMNFGQQLNFGMNVKQISQKKLWERRLSPCLQGTLSPCTKQACLGDLEELIQSCPVTPATKFKKRNEKKRKMISQERPRICRDLEESEKLNPIRENLAVSGDPNSLSKRASVTGVQPSRSVQQTDRT